ncbi:MAG: UbiA family prenyltransferase [Lysobacterales bacterium]
MPDSPPPLCVDLDGTLLRTDLLLESVLALLRRQPAWALALPLWLLRGRAHLKRQIAARVELDPALLPYDERVLDWLRGERAHRALVLCTAADARLASGVGDHLALFDAVIASDGARNLAGAHKAQALAERYGSRGFDYAGNESRDLAVWRQARRAVVVNAAPGLAAAAAAACEVEREFPRQDAGLRGWIRALRLHQWLKNLLVFLPLLAAHHALDLAALGRAGLAFLAFGLCASGVYLLNDLLDLDADRRHPRKRLRPFAAGTLPLQHGLVAAPLLTFGAFALALWLAPRFALVLGGYYTLTLAYSLLLKRIVMLDVVVLAALYTVRIVAGGVATSTPLSFWLLAFSMFLFLSLAMLKRYTELRGLLQQGRQQASGRGYDVEDLPLLQSLGGASGYLAVLVLALYINSAASEALYHHPQVLWLLCPLLLYWVSRAWVIAHRDAMHDDPLVFAARDRVSWLVLALAAGATLAAL